jgi:hypothetical protein
VSFELEKRWACWLGMQASLQFFTLHPRVPSRVHGRPGYPVFVVGCTRTSPALMFPCSELEVDYSSEIHADIILRSLQRMRLVARLSSRVAADSELRTEVTTRNLTCRGSTLCV